MRACVILVSWFTLQTISDGYAMLRAAFPGKLIIPSIGNCETFPDYQIGCGADRLRPEPDAGVVVGRRADNRGRCRLACEP